MYRNIAYTQSKDKKHAFIDLWTWDDEGNPIQRRIPHKSFVTYEVDFKTNLLSIHNTYLKRKFFETTTARYRWIKDHPEKKLYESSKPEFEFLNATYGKQYRDPDFAKHELRIHYFDLEVAVEDSFPNTTDIAYPINLITVYDSHLKGFFTWALGECESHRDDLTLFKFKSEVDLLNHYVDWHTRNYPDVITDWNGIDFDIPYICGRIQKVLGKETMNRLSPIGRVKCKKDRHTERPRFDIVGITHWDYFILYKYKFQKKSSGAFSLGNVGEFLKLGDKLKISGSYKDQWKNDFQHYFEYNVRDVEILKDIEEDQQLLKLARSMMNMSLAPYDTIYASIPYIMNCMYMFSLNRDGRIFPKVVPHGLVPNKFKGAYVFPTQAGFYHDGVAVIDLNSLYPNTLIAGNMSPETKVGTFDQISDTEYAVHLVNGTTKNVTDIQFAKLLETKCICTDNNTLFFKHEIKEGVVPAFCSMLYADRKKYQKKMNQAKRQLSKTKEEKDADPGIIKQLEFEKTQFDLIQTTWKNFLNSVYGMYGTEHSPICDYDIAQSITLNGQFVIKAIPEYVAKWMKDEHQAEGDVVLFGDTDSIGINYEAPMNNYCKEHNKDILKLSRTDIKEILKPLDKFIHEDVNEYCAKIVNERFHTSRGDVIAFAREKFCMEAMFFSKKHYILHIIDKDGHKADEFDYKGVDIAKNELPKDVKAFLKPIFERICRERWDQNKFNTEVEAVWDSYKEMSFEQLKRNTGWATYKKSTGFLQVEKGALAYVRAAHYHNNLLEHLGLKDKYNEIQLGDDVQWCWINPSNPFGIDVIGYSDVYPKEFRAMFQIDYASKFDKDILKPLSDITSIMHWIPFNPNDQSEENIFDL